MQKTAAERFLEQNEDASTGLTEGDLAAVVAHAEHHAGGLFVLWRPLEDGLSVKMHDDWGGDEGVVVNTYDSEDPDMDAVEFFDNGHDALARFLEVTGLEPDAGSTPATFHAVPVR